MLSTGLAQFRYECVLSFTRTKECCLALSFSIRYVSDKVSGSDNLKVVKTFSSLDNFVGGGGGTKMYYMVPTSRADL